VRLNQWMFYFHRGLEISAFGAPEISGVAMLHCYLSMAALYRQRLSRWASIRNYLSWFIAVK